MRQASLAPQLRDSSQAGQAPDDPAAGPDITSDRSPEDARATIAAIQQGWQRGRSVFDAAEQSATTPADEPPAEVGTGGDNGSAGAHQDDE